MGAVEHLQDLVVIDSILQPFGNVLELVEVQHTVLIGVVDGEHSLASVLGLDLTNSAAHDVQVLLEGQGFVLVPQGVDQVQDELVSALSSEVLKSLGDFSGVNGAGIVVVKDVEGVKKVIVVFLADSVFPCGRLGGGGGSLCLGSAHLDRIK